MAEMFGKVTAAAAGAAARCTCSTRRRASTAATPSSAAGCRSRSGWRSPTQMRGAHGRHRLLLRRGRRGRGRVPRVDEPRGAVEAAGAVPLREQPLRDGHGARALGVADRHRRPRPRRTACAPGAWTAWTCSRSRRPCATRRACARDGGGPVLLEFRTYRFRAHSMFDAAAATATRRRSRSGAARTRSCSLTTRLQGRRAA